MRITERTVTSPATHGTTRGTRPDTRPGTTRDTKRVSRRVTVLVIDSFGIGALPDAGDYGDTGANTALSVCRAGEGVPFPTLRRMGLGNCSTLLGTELPGCEPEDEPSAWYGAMAEYSPGKDTTTGHWELAGVHLDEPFTTFPDGPPSFPAELLDAFTARTGLKVLGNKAASGTRIIEELGQEHLATGRPIVYTSSDSVFQIAAHENVLPVPELYSVCETARELCDPYRVARVIARPFVGTPGSFTRTADRRDFSMAPPEPTILDHLQIHGVETIGVGKIGDIFCERGLDHSVHAKGNPACLHETMRLMEHGTIDPQFIFVNLVDTDMVYGHRRDAEGYRDAVAAVDRTLPAMMRAARRGYVIVVTADHGCDPEFRGTDHTREYVPVLWWDGTESGRNIGVREQFSDLAQSVAVYFGVPPIENGVSFVPARVADS